MIDKLSWMTVYPEMVLLVMACIIALVDLRHGILRIREKESGTLHQYPSVEALLAGGWAPGCSGCGTSLGLVMALTVDRRFPVI